MLFSMFLEMFMGISVGVIIILTIIAIVGFLTVLFTCGSILYSRIALSLLVGLVAGSQTDLVSNGFLNFLIWAAIGAAIVFGLSMFPRSNSAISFFCTLFITTLVVTLVAGGAFSLYGMIVKSGAVLKVNKGYEIFIKVLATFFAIGAYIKQYEKESILVPTGLIGVNFDRLIASAVIGFSLVYLVTPFNGNWYTSETLQWIVLIAGTLLAFVVDMFLHKE